MESESEIVNHEFDSTVSAIAIVILLREGKG